MSAALFRRGRTPKKDVPRHGSPGRARWLVVLAVSTFLPAAEARAQTHGRVFTARSFSGPVLPVYEVIHRQLVPFAMVNAGQYIGAMAVRGDGRLFVTTTANNGSLYDITDGGDLTSTTPLAQGIFPQGASPEGMAFDPDGNAFISNTELGVQPVAIVAPDGTVGYLPDLYDNPIGLAVLNGLLYIVEGGQGQVWTWDLSSGDRELFATGFRPGGSHVSGALTVDRYGRLLLMSSTGGAFGVYDISAGGDFTGLDPLVPAPASFYVDINGIAVDRANNLYLSSGRVGTIYKSHYHRQTDTYKPFEAFVTGLDDTEVVAVLAP